MVFKAFPPPPSVYTPLEVTYGTNKYKRLSCFDDPYTNKYKHMPIRIGFFFFFFGELP